VSGATEECDCGAPTPEVGQDLLPVGGLPGEKLAQKGEEKEEGEGGGKSVSGGDRGMQLRVLRARKVGQDLLPVGGGPARGKACTERGGEGGGEEGGRV